MSVKGLMMTEFVINHWRGIQQHRLLKLPIEWAIKVKPGQVILWRSKPELVTRGNQVVYGYVYTMDQKSKQHRRRAEQWKTIPALQVTR